MPFLAPILPLIAGIGSAAGSIAAARGQGRAADAQIQQGQDRNATEAARLNLQAPGMRAGNAARGDVLSNGQDFKWGAPSMVGNIPVPSSTGGLRPSMFSPQTKQLGALQSAQALTGAQTNGGNVASVTPLEQPNWLDKILGVAGTIGGLGAGVQDATNLQSALPYATAKRKPLGPSVPGEDEQTYG